MTDTLSIVIPVFLSGALIAGYFRSTRVRAVVAGLEVESVLTREGVRRMNSLNRYAGLVHFPCSAGEPAELGNLAQMIPSNVVGLGMPPALQPVFARDVSVSGRPQGQNVRRSVAIAAV